MRLKISSVLSWPQLLIHVQISVNLYQQKGLRRCTLMRFIEILSNKNCHHGDVVGDSQ